MLCAVFSGTQCGLEAFRGVKSYHNSVAGGVAAGVGYGLMYGDYKAGVKLGGFIALAAASIAYSEDLERKSL
jgi:hypothetical protein